MSPPRLSPMGCPLPFALRHPIHLCTGSWLPSRTALPGLDLQLSCLPFPFPTWAGRSSPKGGPAKARWETSCLHFLSSLPTAPLYPESPPGPVPCNTPELSKLKAWNPFPPKKTLEAPWVSFLCQAGQPSLPGNLQGLENDQQVA